MPSREYGIHACQSSVVLYRYMYMYMGSPRYSSYANASCDVIYCFSGCWISSGGTVTCTCMYCSIAEHSANEVIPYVMKQTGAWCQYSNCLGPIIGNPSQLKFYSSLVWVLVGASCILWETLSASPLSNAIMAAVRVPGPSSSSLASLHTRQCPPDLVSYADRAADVFKTTPGIFDVSIARVRWFSRSCAPSPPQNPVHVNSLWSLKRRDGDSSLPVTLLNTTQGTCMYGWCAECLCTL